MDSERMDPAEHKISTFIEAVQESLLKAGHYNAADSVAPVAILWTDVDGEWIPLVPRLRALMPELLTLGEYAPERKTGPAIWLRCVIEGTLPDVTLPGKLSPLGKPVAALATPGGETLSKEPTAKAVAQAAGSLPVIYLPQISRQSLRSPEDCPDLLKPLVELQYRGAVWTQANSKDWTVEAFLVSEDGGLGLDMARDGKTREAMLGALEALAGTPVGSLRGRKLEAEDFDKLMIGDTIRDLLAWIGDPAGARAEWDNARWSAFCSRCREEYGFDPGTDGELVAAEKLGLRQNPWSAVWRRFAESPSLYPRIPPALRRAKPGILLFDREPWPDENEKEEDALRGELSALGDASPTEARNRIARLDELHGQRRAWVWARLGLSSLAGALNHLRVLAERTAMAMGGDTPDIFVEAYTQNGWRADDAALRALASAKTAEDQRAIAIAVRCIYLPWLDDSARNFQKAIERRPLPDIANLKDSLIAASPGECILFVDGLRFDVSRRLLSMAHERKLQYVEKHRWSPLPTVTSTAKPAVSPVASALSDGVLGQDFYPLVAATRKPATTDRLHVLLAETGYQVLRGLDTGRPSADGAKAWAECGEFDKLGHGLQAKLAARVDEQLDLILDRIVGLLEAGWLAVRVITDHGWLLAPGPLPSLPLQKYLVECRWARCAVFNEGARGDVPTARWFWDADQSFAYAPGVHCFGGAHEYAHGGISLQECLVPDLTFRFESGSRDLMVSIKSAQWLGLRCRVVIEPPAPGLIADLRTKPNDPRSSVATPRSFDAEGRSGLLVEDDALIGTAVNLVILNPQGHIIAKSPTTVGGDA